MSPAPGVEALAASRVMPRGNASEYAFTQFQAPGMPDDVFQKNAKALERHREPRRMGLGLLAGESRHEPDAEA